VSATIGLRRHTVRLVAHRHEWRVLFESERRALLERVGHLAVEVQHVGSTAVEGLEAKPIIASPWPSPPPRTYPDFGVRWRGWATSTGATPATTGVTCS